MITMELLCDGSCALSHVRALFRAEPPGMMRHIWCVSCLQAAARRQPRTWLKKGGRGIDSKQTNEQLETIVGDVGSNHKE